MECKFKGIESIAPAHAISDVIKRIDAQSSYVDSPRPLAYPSGLREQALQRKIIDLEDALKAARRELLQVKKLTALGQLAAGITHEMNTPLQYVSDNVLFLRASLERLVGAVEAGRALLTAVQEGASTAAAVEHFVKAQEEAELSYILEEIPCALEQCEEGLKRVNTIVSAMKDFSHPNNGNKAPTDIKGAIESTITITRNVWKHIADIETRFPPDLPLVPCLRDEFSQVILNLIVNAADAISEVTQKGATGKGLIQISARVTGDWLEVTVSDTGGGIPEEIQKYVFTPFFTTKGVGKGTGQGLSIAYSSVVDKHHGHIDFVSTPGEGTTFHILLPLREEAR